MQALCSFLQLTGKNSWQPIFHYSNFTKRIFMWSCVCEKQMQSQICREVWKQPFYIRLTTRVGDVCFQDVCYCPETVNYQLTNCDELENPMPGVEADYLIEKRFLFFFIFQWFTAVSGWRSVGQSMILLPVLFLWAHFELKLRAQRASPLLQQ